MWTGCAHGYSIDRDVERDMDRGVDRDVDKIRYDMIRLDIW